MKKKLIPLIIAIIFLIIGTSIVLVCTQIFKLNITDSIMNSIINYHNIKIHKKKCIR